MQKTTKETKALIVAKDHFAEGGIGEAVKSALEAANIISLAVRKIPGSEKPEELILYEEISKETIVREVKKLL